jgi:glycosyltransferase involved in cell wall biosynthesis
MVAQFNKPAQETTLVSIVCPTFNEEQNVEELYQRILLTLSGQNLKFEVIFIDNASTDNTVQKLRNLAAEDSRVKLILNARNFGHIRSPYYGLLQANGDAVALLASDLQDPPEMLNDFIEAWRDGNKVVLAVKSSTDEKWSLRIIRRAYYSFVSKLSSDPLVKNATGAGLFDKAVIDQLRKLKEPYPYFRGLVTELGFKVKTIDFHQPQRKSGRTKNNFFTLYDMAILGITTHSGAPMRVISILGFGVAVLSFMVALGYFIAKLLFWDSFQMGFAPLILGVFFFGSLQISLIGLLGEYLANIQRRIRNMPLVIEDERVNFEK